MKIAILLLCVFLAACGQETKVVDSGPTRLELAAQKVCADKGPHFSWEMRGNEIICYRDSL